MENRDITEIIANYRECVRHVWNTYFRPMADEWNEFMEVDAALFTALVLKQISATDDFYENETEFVEAFTVITTNLDEVLWANEQRRGYSEWQEVGKDVKEIRLKFIGLDDWTYDGFRDFQFVRCRITDCTDKKIIGADAFCKWEDVRVQFEEPD